MKSPDQAAFKAILIITVIIAIAMLPFVAKAESQQRHSPPAFSDIDTDGDGFVSEEEFNSFRAARMAAKAEAGKPMKGAATAPAFGDLDSDDDGLLSEDELTAGHKAHKKAMHEQHGSGDGQGKQHRKGMKMPTFGDLGLRRCGPARRARLTTPQAEHHGKQ